MSSPRPDVVGGLLELDPQRPQAVVGHVRAFAVNHHRAVMFRQPGQHLHCQHVAARKRLVTQDAVVEQVVGRAVVNAQQRRLHGARAARGAGFCEPDMRGQVLEFYFGIDPALVVEHLGAELVKAEAAAALPTNCLGNTTLLSVKNFYETWMTERACMFPHLYANPSPPHFVRNGRRGSGAEETIQYKVAFIRRNLDYAFHQTFWFWRIERSLLSKNEFKFTGCVLIETDIIPDRWGCHACLGFRLEQLPHRCSCLTIFAPEKTPACNHLLHYFSLIDPTPP